MRRLRYVPEGGALAEVTCRTLHSRFLLRPGRDVNDIIVGVLARTQQMYPIRICAFSFLSGHFHLLLDVDDARQLSRFMCYLNSNLAREIGRLVGSREKIFGRRYQAIPVSSEEWAQADRLRYVLSQGVKENLVEKVTDWPGVHCVRALVEGATVEGHWYNRTQEYAARRRNERFDPMQFATIEVLKLSPLPCWKHLPTETQRRLVAAMVADIEQEAALRRERMGSEVLGVSAILGQHPFDRPARPKKSPAPLFHAASKRAREELYAAYAWFVDAYRQASAKLRSGIRDVTFRQVASRPRCRSRSAKAALQRRRNRFLTSTLSAGWLSGEVSSPEQFPFPESTQSAVGSGRIRLAIAKGRLGLSETTNSRAADATSWFSCPLFSSWCFSSRGTFSGTFSRRAFGHQ